MRGGWRILDACVRVGTVIPIHVGDLLHVLVPELGVGMPTCVDAVVPGLVVRSEVVVGIFAVIEAVCARVERIAAVMPGIDNTGVASQLGVCGPGHDVATRR